MIARWILVFCLIITPALIVRPALAVEPMEQLSDTQLEQRAREVSKYLRCVVCQNQSIDDSNAPLAADMRRMVRERITIGDTNDQVLDFMVQRYGNFVLLQPPLNQNTFLLWFGPIIFILIGGLVFWLSSRRKPMTTPPTSPAAAADDQDQINEILKRYRK